jgi:hypothetical protein
MNLAYRRLNDGLPASGGEALRRFPPDPRSARTWVAALPRANAQATQMELSDALDSLAGQHLKGTQRLLVLEELRPAVLESIGLLKRQFAGSALPLPGLKARASQHAETFQLDMAAADRKAAAEICAPEGRIPMLRGAAVAKALQRSIWHYLQACEFAWRLYRAPAAGVWQGLHRVYRYAAERRLEARQIDDAGNGQNDTIQSLYLQALLMSVAHPLAYSQAEQDTLWKLSKEFSGFCPLQPGAQGPQAVCVPEDADQGPGQRLEEESNPLWLDLDAFRNEVSDALARARDGYAEVIPGRGLGIRVAADMLQRLQRAFGMAAARTHSRRLAGHTLQTVFGLSALHYYLTGRRDFDTFVRQVAMHEHHHHDRALWAVADPEAAKVPMYQARVLDQSLGGYRMSWDQAQQIRARVGELVGVNFAEDGGDPDWMLGIVRWLRYEPNNALMAGVDLLSRRAIAIGLRVGEDPSAMAGKPPIRAVALEAMAAGDGMSYLVAGELPATPVRVAIMRDDDDLSLDHLPNVPHVDIQSALSMGDYSLLKPARAEPLAVPPVPLEAMVSAEPVLTQQAEPAMAPEPEPEPEPGAQPEIEFVEHYESVEFIEAFAETDEPVESLLLFTDSYEVIEPAPEDEDKPGDRTDSEWDDLR